MVRKNTVCPRKLVYCLIIKIIFLFWYLDDKGLRTYSITETLYESVILKECTFDSEVSREIADDQNVTHLDNVSGKY